MTPRLLARRAEDMDIADEEVDDADGQKDRKGALIALILRHHAAAEERAARERAERLERLLLVGIKKWSEAQVLEWTALIDLPPGAADAARTAFEGLYDGEDLADLKGKLLTKMLAKAGLEESEAAAQVLLLARENALYVARCGPLRRGPRLSAR